MPFISLILPTWANDSRASDISGHLAELAIHSSFVVHFVVHLRIRQQAFSVLRDD
jgi:hypothetical protein